MKWQVLAAVLAIGCVPALKRDPLYDGETITETSADSAYMIPIFIENNRTMDPVDPQLYLMGSGRHSLGIVPNMGGKLSRLVDSSWLGPDGCIVIVAHYVGGRDLVFDKVCWHPGERIDVALDDIFNPVASWSHR